MDNLARRIKDEKATDMQDITYHAQHSIAVQGWDGQPAPRPDDDIVGQRAQQHQHLLGFKAFFAALAHAQSLLVAFESRFDSASSLIVEDHIGQQYRCRIIEEAESKRLSKA